MKGIMKNKKIIILVDFGSSHNCIDNIVIKQLNPFVYPTNDLTVNIVDGH
jgi:carbamoylphosphate synthase small subunit